MRCYYRSFRCVCGFFKIKIDEDDDDIYYDEEYDINANVYEPKI